MGGFKVDLKVWLNGFGSGHFRPHLELNVTQPSRAAQCQQV
jgi:hypothetical protein